MGFVKMFVQDIVVVCRVVFSIPDKSNTHKGFKHKYSEFETESFLATFIPPCLASATCIACTTPMYQFVVYDTDSRKIYTLSLFQIYLLLPL